MGESEGMLNDVWGNDHLPRALIWGNDRKMIINVWKNDNLPKAFELAEEVENISLQYITSLKLGKPKILSIKEMRTVLSKAKNYKRG